MASLRARSSDVPVTKSGKLPVAEPTSFKKFTIIFVMHMCRKVLLVDTTLKLAIYCIGIPVVSLVTDLVRFPPSYFSRRDNILNVAFVKLGWGWTCGLLTAYIWLTCQTYCGGKKKMVQRHLYRMVVGTVWWYLCTTFFNYIDNVTGFCSVGETVMTKAECFAAEDGKWLSFDISGHTFLLMYCSLMISEEVKCVRGWERIPELLQNPEERQKQKLTQMEFEDMKESYEKYLPYVRICVVFITLLSIIWEIMLLSTALYFHNMPQKVAGGAIAVLGWLITYQSWYHLDMSPGKPGNGILNYSQITKKKK